jgi:hypothetical protein
MNLDSKKGLIENNFYKVYSRQFFVSRHPKGKKEKKYREPAPQRSAGTS